MLYGLLNISKSSYSINEVNMKEILEELEKRRVQARNGGGADRTDAQHKKGKLTARERLDVLLDENSFEEFDISLKFWEILEN